MELLIVVQYEEHRTIFVHICATNNISNAPTCFCHHAEGSFSNFL